MKSSHISILHCVGESLLFAFDFSLRLQIRSFSQEVAKNGFSTCTLKTRSIVKGN